MPAPNLSAVDAARRERWMPLSSVKLETEYCLDAKHAQDELLACVRALAAEDTRLHFETTGEVEITTIEGHPKIVCEIMDEGPGLLWRGRLSAIFSSGAVGQDVTAREAADMMGVEPEEIFDTVRIPGWPGVWNIRHDMSAVAQIEMWQEHASEYGASAEVLNAGTAVLTAALRKGR